MLKLLHVYAYTINASYDGQFSTFYCSLTFSKSSHGMGFARPDLATFQIKTLLSGCLSSILLGDDIYYEKRAGNELWSCVRFCILIRTCFILRDEAIDSCHNLCVSYCPVVA
jgi:hypothetical protein